MNLNFNKNGNNWNRNITGKKSGKKSENQNFSIIS